MSIIGKIKDFFSKQETLSKGGGDVALEKQKKRGKLTARERVDEILDSNSFLETDLFVEHDSTDFGMDKKKLAGDGVVTGYGKINNKPIAIFAQDFTVAGGSLGKAHAQKIVKVMDGAGTKKIPLIGINDSGGARIQEGVDSLYGYGEIFLRNTTFSGVIPQLSLILGPCAGGAVYSPALTDFVFVVEKVSNMFITGPQVIKTVLGEDVSPEVLGGAKTHTSVTGNAHFYAETEFEAFEQIKRLLSFLPANCLEKPPVLKSAKPKNPIHDTIIPDNRRKAYDVTDVIKGIVDNGDFMQVHERYAQNIVVGFARIDGKSVGVIANQPKHLAGVLDVNASDKAARFIRFCDAFGISLLTFVDTPGYLPGVDQEHAGVIRHGAKLLYSYSEATVPKVTVIMRKAYGGAYIAMCSRHLGASSVIAWPTAEIAVMGAEGAANIVFRKEIGGSDDPEATRQEKIKEYEDKFANPYVAASKGYVDILTEPHKTRDTIIKAFEFAGEKDHGNSFRRHGNIPL